MGAANRARREASRTGKKRGPYRKREKKPTTISVHDRGGDVQNTFGPDDPDPVSEVVELDTMRPHAQSSVVCPDCGHAWIAVYMPEVEKLECPGCGRFEWVVQLTRIKT
jgi:transposase